MARVPNSPPRSLIPVVLTTLVVAFTCGVAVRSADFARQQPPTTPPTTVTQPSTAARAAPAGPAFLMLNIVDVKPDMVSEYVTLQKNETIPSLQKAGIEWRDAWRTGVFGTNFTVAYITPLASFASLDGPNPMEKALGTEGMRAYNAKLANCITGNRRYALRPRPDLGYRPEGSGGAMPKLGVLASVEALASRLLEFEGLLKTDWAPALKKAGVPMYTVSQVVFGGPITEYYTFTPIENFAQLDKGHPIQQSIGEAGLNKLMARMGATIHHAERIIIRYDDELSFKTTKATSQMR